MIDLTDGINSVVEMVAAIAAGAFGWDRFKVFRAKSKSDVSDAQAGQATAEASKAASDNLRLEIERLAKVNNDLASHVARLQMENIDLRSELATLKETVVELNGFVKWYQAQRLCPKCPLRNAEVWRLDTFGGVAPHPQGEDEVKAGEQDGTAGV